VADLVAMRAALARVHARFGVVHGVFHAAGVLKDELIALRTSAAASTVIDAKMKGALVLDALLAGEPLELFVLFSSVSSILGLPGQADYTAANAFLDAFAHARARRGPGRTLSIDWNGWQEVGMLATRVRREHADAHAHGTHEAPPRGERSETGHPDLETVVSDDRSATLFRTSFRRSGTWMLGEHMVRGGDALIPGTGFLEIARAALEYRKEARAVELRDVLFLAPFAVGPDGERTLHLRIERDGERAFSCYGESEKELFVVGKAGYVEAPPAARADLNAIRARCHARGEVANGRLVQHFMDFGSRWESVKRIDLGHREALVSLELPAVLAGDLDVYRLHPALLDLATGGAQALVPGFDARATFYVPFSYGRVLLRRTLTERLFSHVRLRDGGAKDSVVFDVTLFDEGGQEIASVEGFVMRKVAPGFVVAQPKSAPSDKGRRHAMTHGEAPDEAALREGMTPAEGVEALDRMLAVDFSPQVVACTVPLHLWLDRLAEEARASVIEDSHSATDAAGPVFARPGAGATFVAPRDEIERELVSLWRGLLGVADIGVNDDFFELGGQSLVAVRLFQRIGKKYGVRLPLATLFQAPTIAECATLLRERLGLPEHHANLPSSVPAAAVVSAPVASAFRALVMLQRGDGRRPFFCVHGAGGNVLNFRDIARAMDPGQPVYGLQASGIDGVTPPHKTIEEMAAAYLTEVRELQPHGPYLLGGYSGGGIVAFEMAQRLTADGEEVGLLAFIDTFHPIPVFSPLERLSRRLGRLRKHGLSYVIRALEERRSLAQEARDLHISDEDLAHRDPVPFARRDPNLSLNIDLGSNFERAVRHYSPKSWPGRATLIRAEKVSFSLDGLGPTYGWDRYVLGGIETTTVPGDHNTVVLGPNAELVAGWLSTAIGRASRRYDGETERVDWEVTISSRGLAGKA
jgi:thioesterase domain-containing protein/acyl carrier protein